MKMPRTIFFCLLVFTFGLLQAQVVFTQIPADLQLIPRSAGNTGTFTIAGKSSYTGYPSVETTITELLTNTIVENKVTAIGPGGSFAVTHQLTAGLKEYELTVSLVNGTGSMLVKKVKRLVSGDCFIICGQSNGMAAANWDDPSYSLPYLRGIGSNDDPLDPRAPCVPQNLDFAQANPAWLQNGFVGAWGMKLQHDLALETGIPSCIINGARGGTSIWQNLPSRTPSDISAIDSCLPYDRLYQKVTRHQLNAAVKVLFWYQGETDGDLPADTTYLYPERFHTLYTAWKTDYPNLEKIVVMQVNTGCNQRNLGLLRDLQRQLADTYKDVIVMSTFSSDSSERAGDICHYTFKGYNKLADYLLPLMKKHMYGYKLADTLFMPPAIQKIYPSDKQQLCLEFSERVSVQQDKAYRNSTEYIKDYFYGPGDTRLNLESVSAGGNKVFLNFMAGDELPARITYMPQSLTNNQAALYVGPYIVNANSPFVTALSFSGYPVIAQDSRQVTSDNDFLLYPNPAKNIVHVKLYSTDPGTTLSLIDLQGRLLLQVKAPTGTLAELSVKDYETGIYLIRLDNAAGSFTKKLVLQ